MNCCQTSKNYVIKYWIFSESFMKVASKLFELLWCTSRSINFLKKTLQWTHPSSSSSTDRRTELTFLYSLHHGRGRFVIKSKTRCCRRRENLVQFSSRQENQIRIITFMNNIYQDYQVSLNYFFLSYSFRNITNYIYQQTIPFINCIMSTLL